MTLPLNHMFAEALVDAVKGKGPESFGTVTVDLESCNRPLRVTVSVTDMSDFRDGVEQPLLGTIVMPWGTF